MPLLTIKDLLDAKGQRKLTQVNVHEAHEARACEEAGIDMIITWERSPIRDFRAAAPETFFTVGLVYGAYVNADEAKRAAFDAMEKGADAIYCPMGLDVVEALAREAIPVHGHVGFVPYKRTWTGGFKAVGKTADNAIEVFKRAKAYQDAGAVAIEVELVPVAVATEITKRLSILTVAMGAGSGCDAQYLFAKDILGYNDGHVPRHAKSYRDHGAEYRRLYDDSVAAFAEFKAETQAETFPGQGNVLGMQDAEFEAFQSALEKLG
ncbi:3-methyl-2-oxobutanoate hydroxymethyltransferase [Mameliella sp.]|uniref:3-methyl-2-oxobutanoate hydroxymethyltransferase n=1 Tax=Mameliella sp. TaxID=1924940 RepID=UPI003BADBAEC